MYQDLFHEGSYTGKGIYDIDAFEAALAGKVTDNTLLSHDLFEGIFARAALATDIVLFDEFPSHYEAAAARQHRWARGDWQLLPWIFGHGGLPKEARRRTSIPVISRWKMLDNLRRTLSAPCMFLTMLIGWLLPQVSPWMWTRFILAMIAIPALIPFLVGLNPRFGGISKRSHIRDLSLRSFAGPLADRPDGHVHGLSGVAHGRCDPSHPLRMVVTRRNLLQWVTAAQAKHAVDLNPWGMYLRMFGSVILAIAALVSVIHWRHHALGVAMPFVLLWLAAPAVARWISVPPPIEDAKPLSPADTQTMRLIALRTWRFFERFVTPEDHYLPPDNFQVEPKPASPIAPPPPTWAFTC